MSLPLLRVEGGLGWGRVVGFVVGGMLAIGAGRAEARGVPSFGPHDVQTVFFIDKTDDHNRVDYALRLDAECVPQGKEPLFPYWRVFENAPPVRTLNLGWWEYVAYGLSEQKIVTRSPGSVLLRVQLKQFARPIDVLVRRGEDGLCTTQAKTTIASQEGIEFISVHVTLSKVIKKVLFVDVFGRKPESGEAVSERMSR
ncbi:MAG TPA: DUF4833 domain-containing protein [Pseudomonadota bacterium]|nr:DUF4833 domain-containing protein [Pseudomonadota bacterium]